MSSYLLSLTPTFSAISHTLQPIHSESPFCFVPATEEDNRIFVKMFGIYSNFG